ncbi:hypothetical protein PGTUg99_022560 [Puccinia graminis f. sp. tritici]|uniref:Uncharacterized protein n=1 Tax=Puccinia graminis f. sp. tritici TaxID=56615 RepID=A0A5B0SHB5_PUCGR|nr:hypothetical protein PGTUg99_022560 [Puccinia graminis f. sp. tritici]
MAKPKLQQRGYLGRYLLRFLTRLRPRISDDRRPLIASHPAFRYGYWLNILITFVIGVDAVKPMNPSSQVSLIERRCAAIFVLRRFPSPDIIDHASNSTTI